MRNICGPNQPSVRRCFCSLRREMFACKGRTGWMSVYLQCWWEKKRQSCAVWCLAVMHWLCFFWSQIQSGPPNTKHLWVNLSISFLSGLAECVQVSKTGLSFGCRGILGWYFFIYIISLSWGLDFSFWCMILVLILLRTSAVHGINTYQVWFMHDECVWKPPRLFRKMRRW